MQRLIGRCALLAAPVTLLTLHDTPRPSLLEEKKKGEKEDRKFRIRRINTLLSIQDRVILSYESSLRDNASLEKLFKYFATQVRNDRELLTPMDFVRAITPGAPPSAKARPINIPTFEQDTVEELDDKEVPEFFKFREGDSGLISFGRFLIFLTLVSIPVSELAVAYHMSCGKDFKNLSLRTGNG